MNRFKFCYPDANNFNKVIKIKHLNDWQVEYIPLDHGLGYWIGENPFYDNGFELFRDLIGTFPIQKDNSHIDNFDPNPFDTIHLPEWISRDMCILVKEFYLKNITNKVYDSQIHEWGNVYFKERSSPISCWRLPHIDYVHGMVANLWFTDHPVADSSTKLYYYTGVMYNDVYDFQIDPAHPLYKEWISISQHPTRLPEWYNPSESELNHWGFEFIGETPCKEGTVTMYSANTWHNPYVSANINFRWSHAFAFSHDIPPELSMGDLFK